MPTDELLALRKLAHEIASRRKERTTSVHLIAAIASTDAPAAELLRDRRLDTESLLKATRAFDDDGADTINRLLASARDVATRSPGGEATGIHVLLALLADRSTAAHRSLLQAGVDLGRLRSSAMQLALGVIAARRPQAASQLRKAKDNVPPPRPSAPSRGVAVPLLPPKPEPRAPRPRAEPKLRPGPELRAVKAEAPKAVVPAARFELDRASYPVLSTIGKNLTAAAAEGSLSPVVGREAEIDHVIDVLAKRHANSVCLVGPAGVGKTSVARGLAHRFSQGDGRLLVEVSLAELYSGASARGAIGEKWTSIRSEIQKAAGKVVLFVDEIHELFGPGSFDEAAVEIKAALARGEMSLVGATTPDELRRSIETDSALARRFTVIEIEEPDEADAFLLLRSVAKELGEHHGVRYADDALAACVSWSMRYLPGRALPDKAIAILDFAGARSRRTKDRGSVGKEAVAEVIAGLADLPVERLLETDRARMLGLEKLLAERVVGHTSSLEAIARVLRRNAAGLRARRPIGSFLLLGPTGVGKTEAAKAIAEALFHSADAMTRIDLSEFAEPHSIARLIGAPPGYVGHEAGGQLTEAVRRRPYQVILLDEIEKAHRDVLEAFLQVFDEGRMTDGRGRRVDFTNAVIVLTSNLGSGEVAGARSEKSVGFGRSRGAVSNDKLAELMIAAARSHLPPELYNRFDEVLCFAPLTRAEVAEIARRSLEAIEDTLAARGVRLDVDPAAIEALLDAGGFDPDLGARPMRRTIGRLVENPLAELLLKGDLADGSVAIITVEEGEIVVDAVKSVKAAAG